MQRARHTRKGEACERPADFSDEHLVINSNVDVLRLDKIGRYGKGAVGVHVELRNMAANNTSEHEIWAEPESTETRYVDFFK